MCTYAYVHTVGSSKINETELLHTTTLYTQLSFSRQLVIRPELIQTGQFFFRESIPANLLRKEEESAFGRPACLLS